MIGECVKFWKGIVLDYFKEECYANTEVERQREVCLDGL
jgi:hypothetical protein